MVNTTKPKMGAEYYMPKVISNANSLNKVAGLIWHGDEFDNNIFELGYSFPTYQDAYDASESLKFALKWHFLREQAIELAKKENGYTERQGGFYAVWDGFKGEIDIQYSPMHYKLPVLLWPSKELLFNAILIFGVDNYKKYILEMENEK